MWSKIKANGKKMANLTSDTFNFNLKRKKNTFMLESKFSNKLKMDFKHNFKLDLGYYSVKLR